MSYDEEEGCKKLTIMADRGYLKLFGTPTLETDGKPAKIARKKAAALLAYLAVTGQPHERERLCGLLWPEADGPSAKRSLRSVLADLRRILPEGVLKTEGGAVKLVEDGALTIDTSRFLSDGNIELYTADFLAGFFLSGCAELEDWIFSTADYLRVQYAGRLDKLIRKSIDAKDYAGAITNLSKKIGLDPLDEAAHRSLMEIYLNTGDRSSALRQYERCRQLLAAELEIEPDEATKGIHLRIRNSKSVPGSAASSIDESKPLPAVPEIRVVSILVVGLSQESDDSWELRDDDTITGIEMIERRMTEQVREYEGRIEAVMGDDIVAVFGYPRSYEDDPERAALTALAMRVHAAENGLSISASICTGAVIFQAKNNTGTKAFGPLLNAAIRCRYAASAEEILIDRKTYKRISRISRCEVLEDAGTEPGRWNAKLVGWGKDSPGPARWQPESPFLGRDIEMQTVGKTWDEVLAGSRQVLFITGEAGVGKSRLISEIKRNITGPVVWYTGQCTERGQNQGFGPFLEILIRLFESMEGGAPEDLNDRLNYAVEILSSNNAINSSEKDSSLSILSQVFGRSGDSETLQLQMTKNEFHRQSFFLLKSILETFLPAEPVVLLLEDLHWADDLSVDLLNYLGESASEKAYLIICSNRPERETLSDSLSHSYAGSITEINLPLLTPKDEEKLIKYHIPDENLRRRRISEVSDRARGNPFFIEELAAAARSGKTAALPESIQKVMQRNIDDKDAGTRAALQAASVAGFTFEFRLAAEICRKAGIAEEDQDIRERLTSSNTVSLITRNPSEKYAFRHALLHEAFHATLPGDLHRRLHAAAGEALEEQTNRGRNDNVEALAEHFHSGSIHDKARTYLESAGDRARSIHSLDTAIDRYTRAVEHASAEGDAEFLYSIYLKLGTTYHQNYNFSDSAEAYKKAFEAQRKYTETITNGFSDIPALRMENPLGKEMFYTEAPVVGLRLLLGCTRAMLFRMTVEGSVVPELVSSWEVSADGLTYSFALRDNFHWSDGKSVTAVDAAEGIKRCLVRSLDQSSQGSYYLFSGTQELLSCKAEDIPGIKVIDDYHFALELNHPSPNVLHLLSFDQMAPLPAHVVHFRTGSTLGLEHRLTSGPFTFGETAESGAIRLMRNPGFPGFAPGNLREIYLFPELNNLEEQVEKFKDGSSHILAVTNKKRLPVEMREKVFPGPRTSLLLIQFNPFHPQFMNPDLRIALAKSLDRNSLAEVALGIRPTEGGAIPPGIPGHNPSIGYRYDPDGADKHMKKLPQKFKPIVFDLTYNYEAPVIEEFAREISRQWSSVDGIEAVLKPLQQAEYVRRILNHEYSALFVGVASGLWDPPSYLPTGFGFTDSTTKVMFEELSRCVTFEEYVDISRKIDEYYTRQAIYIPLWYYGHQFLKKSWIKKLPINIDGTFNFNEAVIDPDAYSRTTTRE